MLPKSDFSLAADRFLNKLAKQKHPLEFLKGQTVYCQGDPADSVFYIQKGRIKLSVLSTTGKEAVVSLLEQGNFFGEASLMIGHHLRLATSTSMGHSFVFRFSKQQMRRRLNEDPEFAEIFVGYMVAHSSRVEADLVDQLFNSAEKRLARILLLLAHFGDRKQPLSELPKISQETLAQMVGASRARVNAFLNKFRRLGFIDYRGVIRIHSSLLRVILHD
jgi:CRP/FNR family cyclic AMP-dependent transcriptional regulator